MLFAGDRRRDIGWRRKTLTGIAGASEQGDLT